MAAGSTTPVLTYFQNRLASPSDSDSSSCSTSWEFCSVPYQNGGTMCYSSPIPHCSKTCSIPEDKEILQFHSPLSCSTPRATKSLTLRQLGSPEWLRGHSSSASSSGSSQRSHDSGFLDSVELRRREGLQRSPDIEYSHGSVEAQVLETIYGETILAPASPEQRSSLVDLSPIKPKSPTTRISPKLNHDNFQTLNKNMRSERDRNNNQGKKSRSPSLNLPQFSTNYTTRSSGSTSQCHSEKAGNFEKQRWELSSLLLPKGFKRRVSPAGIQDDVVIKSHFENDAMRRWLFDLRFENEPDCLHTLQVKSVSGQRSSRSGNVDKICYKRSIATVLESLKRTEKRAGLISQEISSIWKYLESGHCETSSILNLAGELQNFLKDGDQEPGDRKRAELDRALSQAVVALRKTVTPERSTVPRRFSQIVENFQLNLDSPNTSREIWTNGSDDQACQVNLGERVDTLVQVARTFDTVVGYRLKKDLSAILESIGSGGHVGRLSVQVLSTVLYDGGGPMCRLGSSLPIVRTILSVLIDSQDDMERTYCLRCLATILCIGNAVNDFDKAGGFEIITDILQDETEGDLGFKIEAIAVLTQATDPWIDLDTTLTSLGLHLPSILFSLTRLIPQCQWDDDSFLLTVAAISNLTFLELSSIEYLRAFKTVSVITNVLKNKADSTVFVLDHISTILANMAGIESCREEIVNNHGIEFLVKFLTASPLRYNSQAEVTATERLQQKSTIAISRLANENGVAQLVLDQGGIHRLVQLCRDDRDRNYSDGVLIAALATLRKLVSICGASVVEELEAEELIVPRLLDSFLLFSSRQESYV